MFFFNYDSIPIVHCLDMLNVVFCNFIKIIRQGCIRGEEASTRNGISSSGLSEKWFI